MNTISWTTPNTARDVFPTAIPFVALCVETPTAKPTAAESTRLRRWQARISRFLAPSARFGTFGAVAVPGKAGSVLNLTNAQSWLGFFKM
jgi:hypothetical protein